MGKWTSGWYSLICLCSNAPIEFGNGSGRKSLSPDDSKRSGDDASFSATNEGLLNQMLQAAQATPPGAVSSKAPGVP